MIRRTDHDSTDAALATMSEPKSREAATGANDSAKKASKRVKER